MAVHVKTEMEPSGYLIFSICIAILPVYVGILPIVDSSISIGILLTSKA
jgi:hypothetical protein